ncbi:hypothetical protein NIES4073_11010 [Kalymmatonema gypsitolerans NIES-4073]|nr:hypothetical protein NIES4073_11010 [Scytonema sp. NIES-4073]
MGNKLLALIRFRSAFALTPVACCRETRTAARLLTVIRAGSPRGYLVFASDNNNIYARGLMPTQRFVG